MEIENETKKEKKKFSFFCCFSSNCGKSNLLRKIKKNNPITPSTNVVKVNGSNNSIKSNSKPEIKEFVLSSEKENTNKINNDNNIYSNESKEFKVYSINKISNINIDFSVIKEKSNIKNKTANDNNMNKKMNKNSFEKTTNKINNNIYSNTYEKSESQTEKIMDEKSSIKTINFMHHITETHLNNLSKTIGKIG